MKIRILNDHVRLRLDRSEVDAVAAGRAVAARTRFPHGNTFGYRLEAAPAVAAAFEAGTIVIGLPEAALRAWAEDDTKVSIRESLALTDGVLTVLVEKDFECLEPRAGEDQTNRFPNPKLRR